jgi:hypothetical protein
MSGIQSKITRHTKKQETIIYEKNKSIEIDQELTQITELAHR